MDPLCHTLVGASLGCTGLEKTTRYSRVTLIVAANLPDIDVVAHLAGGTASYAFRRGITHGIPALVLLPTLLTLTVLLLHRAVGRNRDGPPVAARWLFFLSLIGVWSHPLLDWMNTYGMRWLMPMVDRWYYGDTLFIMDWIIWSALIAGLLLSRRRAASQADRLRPATVALVAVAAYIAVNFGITRLAEQHTRAALAADPPQRLLASPVPFDPLTRAMVLEYADEYRFGTYRPGSGFSAGGRKAAVAKGDERHLELARESTQGQWFLHWARFPYSMATKDGERLRITIADARYVPDIDNPRIDGFAIYSFEVVAD